MLQVMLVFFCYLQLLTTGSPCLGTTTFSNNLQLQHDEKVTLQPILAFTTFSVFQSKGKES